jgi:membrane protein involved in colicin uptake
VEDGRVVIKLAGKAVRAKPKAAGEVAAKPKAAGEVAAKPKAAGEVAAKAKAAGKAAASKRKAAGKAAASKPKSSSAAAAGSSPKKYRPRSMSNLFHDTNAASNDTGRRNGQASSGSYACPVSAVHGELAASLLGQKQLLRGK